MTTASHDDPTWPFPWPQATGAYTTEGPEISTLVRIWGAEYIVEPTGEDGVHTCRERFRVVCFTCERAGWVRPHGKTPGLLHRATTGPASYIESHAIDQHGAKSEEVYARDRYRGPK